MSSKSQGKGSTTPTLPGWLSSALSGNLAGGQGLPSLLQLFEGFPQLQTSGPQGYDIANMFNVANETPAGQYGMGSYSNAALTDAAQGFRGFGNTAGAQGLEYFIGGGPGKPSAATNAGLKEFSDLQAPGIEDYMSSMGLGNSAAAGDALAQGQEQALVPLLQSDQANQLAASQALGGMDLNALQGLAGVGATKGQLAATQTGLEQNAQQQQLGGLESIFGALNTQNQNLFNQQMGQEGLAGNFRQDLMGLLGQLFGSKQSQSSSSFDPNAWAQTLFG